MAIVITLLTSLSLFADVTTENIVKGKGFLICNGGGGSKPIFNSDCKQLSINRVTSGGSIKYEISCTDTSNTTFQLACDAYSFEQKPAVF